MSRIGKQTIVIPEKTEVTKNSRVLTVKGPLGTISREFKSDIDIHIEGDAINLKPVVSSKTVNALWGTYASHIKNMVDGVNRPFEKRLIVEGVGFRVEVSDNALVLSLGFSHKVHVVIPAGIKVSVEKNIIAISGINKETVGKFAADIRKLKRPEPYKGKCIRYDGEVIRRKQGKKAA